MSHVPCAKAAAAWLALAALAPLSLANTYTVDASGGGDFTDLPQAIAAAAQGDVLLVRGGSYSGFTLSKRLVIVGDGPSVVTVTGLVRIENVATGSSTVVAGMTWNLGGRVLNCVKPIVLDEIATNCHVLVQASSDVRIARSTIVATDIDWSWGYGDGFPGVQVDASRVEIVSSSCTGADGVDDYDPVQAYGGYGGDGVMAHGAGSDAHVYRSDLAGGDGGDGIGTFEPYGDAGDPGTGLELWSSATALVAGSTAQALSGGAGGYGSSCWCWGGPGPAAYVGQASLRISGVTATPIYSFQSLVETPTPADPTLHIVSTPTAGVIETFRVNTEPGSTVDLRMGRNALVTPYLALEEDVLVQTMRVFHLGAVGGSGTVSFNFPVPATLPKGYVFFAQARVTLPNGDVRYTNSVPLVVR